MNPNNKVVKEVLALLLYNPTKLRFLLSKSKDPYYVIRILNKIIPCRTGIEIDLTGFDHKLRSDLRNLRSANEFYVDIDTFDLKTDNVETRFSPVKVTNFINFYKALDILNKHETASPSEKGGIHIHLDLEKYFENNGGENSTTRTTIGKRYKKLFHYIKHIIFQYPREEKSYSGFGVTYSGNSTDRANICIARSHSTVEIRLANSTFNYTQIMKWIVCCHHIHYHILKNTQPNFAFCTSVLNM